MYTHKFQVFANIVYPVQIIKSKVTIKCHKQMIFDKNKKKKKNKKNKKDMKEHAKIKSFTVHLLLFSLIILPDLVTLHTVFATFYFALFQYSLDI